MESILPIFIVILAAWVYLAFVCARMAVQRGRSAGFFFGLGLLLPLITLIILAVMQPIQYQAGQIVRVNTNIPMDDGTSITAGHVSKILDVSVLENTKVVQLTDAGGRPRWIAAAAVRPSA